MTRSMPCLIALAGWTIAFAAAASQGRLLDGELGRWLDGIAPELGETLARHPRFQGETVRLVTLTTGNAGGASNRLAEAVEARLRQRLLTIEGVRLAADRPERDCEPPPEIGYLVRIELAASSRRQARVRIAVVDVVESIWVSGISHQWQGHLSAAERAALQTPVHPYSPGSPGSPIPIEDADAVAEALVADLSCRLPRDLDGALFVAVPEPVALSRVGLALHSALRFEPLAAVTADREQARWLLTLDTESTAVDVREVSLTLADTNGGHQQRVASVFVAGSLVGAQVPTRPVRRVPDVMPTRSAPALLSALEMTPAHPEGICDNRKARVNSCVKATFELLEPAYVFVVATRDHAVVAAPCDGSLERREPGVIGYRMRVPPGSYAFDAADTGPDAGFYVLAVRERAVARALRDTLAAAPGACGGSASRRVGQWLGELRRVLERYGDRVAWRALHVVHDTEGIVAL